MLRFLGLRGRREKVLHVTVSGVAGGDGKGVTCYGFWGWGEKGKGVTCNGFSGLGEKGTGVTCYGFWNFALHCF